MATMRARFFQIAALSILASCGEQKATVGGDKADSAPRVSADTSDSIGKRFGIKMPSTAVEFTQIPARSPVSRMIVKLAASPDGSSVAARTPDSILLLDGSGLTTKTEIPADFAIDRDPWLFDEFAVGKDFVFEYNDYNFRMLASYRITPGHENFGKLESRSNLKIPPGEALLSLKTLNEQVLVLTTDYTDLRLRLFDSNGNFQRSPLKIPFWDYIYASQFTPVNRVTNGKNTTEYWFYGLEVIYRFSAEGKLVATYRLPGKNVYHLAMNPTAPTKLIAYVKELLGNCLVHQIEIPDSAASSANGFSFDNSTVIAEIPQPAPSYPYFGSESCNGVDGVALTPKARPLELNSQREVDTDGIERINSRIIDRLSKTTIRTFTESRFGIFYGYSRSLFISLAENDVLQMYAAKQGPGSPNWMTPKMIRFKGGQAFKIALPQSDNFFNDGLDLAKAIPRKSSQDPIQVLLLNSGWKGTGSPSFGILTLPSSEGSATFAGPYPLECETWGSCTYGAVAISRTDDQVVAYLGKGSVPPSIMAVNLTQILKNTSTSTPVPKAQDIASIATVPPARNLTDLQVKNSVLYGFVAQDGLPNKYIGSLIALDLTNISASPIILPMTQSVIEKLPDWISAPSFSTGAGIAIERSSDGKTVPVVYSNLPGGSVMEIRANPETNTLSDLNFWLRPERASLKFGPASEWLRASEGYYGNVGPGQIVFATTDQFRKSYVSSGTLPEEFMTSESLASSPQPTATPTATPAAAPSISSTELQLGDKLAANLPGKKVRIDSRRVQVGPTFLNCPGFEAKVLFNGNFVVLKYLPGRTPEVIWTATAKPVSGSVLNFNAKDGLVLLAPNKTVEWDSKTGGKGALTLKMQRDGNLVAYNKASKALWDSRGCLLGKCTDANRLVPAACEK